MNSIGLITAWIAGCGLGLFIVGRHPSGLDTEYGGALIALGLLALVPAVLKRGDKRITWSSLFVTAVLVGCGRAIIIHPPATPATLSFYNRPDDAPPVVVVGHLIEDSVILDRLQRVRIGAEQLRQVGRRADIEVSGQLLAVLPRYPHFDTGDRLVLTGTLTAPPRLSGFDYPAYLGRSGIYSYMNFPRATRAGQGRQGRQEQAGGPGRFVAGLRDGMRATLQRYIPEPEAALAVGIVIGDRTSLPEAVREAFQRSGTSHVLAISGQNIALIPGCTQ